MADNTPSELISQALRQALTHSRELQAICGSTGDQLRFGSRNQGFEHLRLVLDGIGSVAHAIHLTSEVQAEQGIRIDLSTLPSVLERVVEALRNRDPILLADLLNYEIEPILAGWAEQLDKVTASLPKASDGRNPD